MFPIGYHIYPYRKLFVCVNTFSRDKVVVPVLLRLSLSHTPPISPFYPISVVWFLQVWPGQGCVLSLRE